ncbi:hypothetical protein ACWD4G_03440 [Streptomyces sp. NPDC002643]
MPPPRSPTTELGHASAPTTDHRPQARCHTRARQAENSEKALRAPLIRWLS